MTEKQFRSWYENKVCAAAARAKYPASPIIYPAQLERYRFRFKVPALIADLEKVVSEAKRRAKTVRPSKIS